MRPLTQLVPVILVLASPLAAQRIDITGVVKDADTGMPLAGANVQVESRDLTTGAAADENGGYRIPSVPPGEYTLTASYIGYDTYRSTVVIRPGEQRKIVNIELAVSAIELQEFVVTARRGREEKITDAPAAISLISETKIRQGNNPNLGEYLKNVKGVDFTASGIDSYNLSARGFNTSFSSRLLTLTDLRMANVPSLRLIAYNTIPATSDDVKQIEVVLGPSSALYGPNAHSGVLNIITKRPKDSQGTVGSITLGTRSYRQAQVRHAGVMGRLGYKISFVDLTAHDWEWVDDEEKKAHLTPWTENDGALGDSLVDGHLGDWEWDGYDIRIDTDGDGAVDTVWSAEDYLDADRNDDGIPDTAEFGVRNRRLDLRLDYDFSRDHFISANFGQAWARNINITGIGRYLADGWIYRYYQLRYVYNNVFAQAYLNTSHAGNTRNLRTGEKIFDESMFFHFQFQHSLEFPQMRDARFIWGMDYQRTMPETFGTILPDGTGGRKAKSYGRDGLDNDDDGKIDELDELIITNEYGVYAQAQADLVGDFELMASGRLDLHSHQTDEKNGLTFLEDPLSGETVKYRPQWSPKVGLLYKPADNQTFRLTTARAFNTPSSQGLFLDILVGLFPPFGVKARGNSDGYHYTRSAGGNLMMYDVRAGSDSEFRLTNVPPTAVLYIPPVLGRPSQFVDPDDYTEIDPVSSEIVWTHEFGYSGLISNRVRATFDLYYSQYSDFVSDLTWVTPVVLDTSQGLDNAEILGVVMTTEYDGIIDGGDGIPGSADDRVDFENPAELSLTNINYGRVSLWGFDMGVFTFLTRNFTAEINASYLGKRSFYNRLTRDYDPINAPEFKMTGSLNYSSPKGFSGGLGFRYIPTFDWSAGVYFGTIEEYFVVDAYLGYRFNNMFTLQLNGSNIFNDRHREIIGGPRLGRHLTARLSTTL
ncbi:MAG: TonB-dependent receptor [Fidelibacterota bacterium]